MSYFFSFLLYNIFLICLYHCNERKIENPETIEKTLFELLNSPFTVEKTLTISKQNVEYNFYIEKITPFFSYKNSTIIDKSIYLNDTKLLLLYQTILTVRNKNYELNNPIIYNNEKSENFELQIFINVDFQEFQYMYYPADNSYLAVFNFPEKNMLKSIKITIDYLDKYKIELKDNMFEREERIFLFKFYQEYMKKTLELYPVCDGLYYYTKLTNYMLISRKYQLNVESLSGFISSGLIKEIKYNNFRKYNHYISIFSNLNVSFSYTYNDYYERLFCEVDTNCYFDEIRIFNYTIKLEEKNIHCKDEIDIEIFLQILNKSTEALEPYL